MTYSIHLLALAIVFSFAGCSIHSQQPALHDFGMLQGSSRANPQASIDVEAPPWLASTKIRYRLLYASPTQIRFYSLDRWIAPPAELFELELESRGSNSGYPLKVRLLDFEQQFDSPGQAKALMSFSAEAYSPDRKSKLASKTFRLERLTTTPDAKGAVTAFSVLSRQAAGQIEIWISGLSKP
ncbi:MAG: ABC-type transport auxiliary lipoprotein family protein [Gammaproteobacteria bacterium]